MLHGKISPVSNRKKVRLLIIGDGNAAEEQGYYAHLKECADLSSHIYEITYNFTQSGVEALKLIGSWEPTVILVDAHLDDMNSFDIVTHSRSQSVPIIVASDYKSTEIEESALSLGAAAYVSKSDNPDDVELLLERIAEIADELATRH